MFLDKLNEELSNIISPTLAGTSSSGFGAKNTSSPKKDKPLEESKKTEEPQQKISAMDDLFKGELITSISCPNCKKKIEKNEEFYYLSVPLPEEV